MSASRALTLCCQLAKPEARSVASADLARELGADALVVFVVDREVDALVPAPGFPQTYPGGPTWRAFLDRCRTPGNVEGEVAFPDAKSRVKAKALVLGDGLVFVLLGGADARLPDPESLALPLLSSTLRAEGVASAARGHLAAEREAARHATALAGALDGARGDLEAALAEAARLNAELERAATERAKLLSSEQSANRSKDEFLAMLGHELRNPLAPIVTALQLMRLRGRTGFEREHGILERQVSHLTGLVDDLLDVSRITRGKVSLKKTFVELSDIVLKAVEMASPLLEERRHHLELSVPKEGLLVEADEGRLAQVTSNLLTNAARYTGAHGKISVTATRVGEIIRLSVRDTGVGIEPHMLESIFGLFVQGERDKDRAEGGLGLGLAIVWNLVAMHDGHVFARSEGKGKGSEFIVELPVASGHVASPKPAPASGKHRTIGPLLRVMVVDDNVDAAELLAEALEYEGYEVRVAHDGVAALALTESFTPDVAVLDIGLPVMDGNELARRLREVPKLAALRLIAATGYGQESDRIQSKGSGFEHHLVKPINLSELVRLISPVEAA